MPDTWMRRAASPRLRAHAPPAAPGPPALVERRSGQDGRLELAVALDGEQRPEQGDAADEVVGAVDRVDVPADRRVGGFAAVLLADETVIRERVEEAPADHPLDLGVGLGHERLVGLGRDLEVAPEMSPGNDIRLVASGQGDVKPAAAARRPCRAGTTPTSPGRRWQPTRRSRPYPRTVGVVQRLACDLEADPVTKDLDLAPGPDGRPIRRQVGVRDRALDREPVATRGHPADDLAADAHRLVAEADRADVVEDQAAQALARPGRLGGDAAHPGR